MARTKANESEAKEVEATEVAGKKVYCNPGKLVIELPQRELINSDKLLTMKNGMVVLPKKSVLTESDFTGDKGKALFQQWLTSNRLVEAKVETVSKVSI